jgi:PAS fold
MFVAWGPEGGFLYNDPYAEILGAKHPASLGGRFHDIWAEIWPDIMPLIDAAMSGEASYREDLPLLMNRRGFDEQTWFTFSYSPVRDESGKVAGMFCAVQETTDRVLAHRALSALNETLEHRPMRIASVDVHSHGSKTGITSKAPPSGDLANAMRAGSLAVQRFRRHVAAAQCRPRREQ